MELLEILQTLNACHGPAGDERGVAEAIRRLAQPCVDSCATDAMGSLICHKKGSGAKILFAAHMDTVGLVVTHIDEKAFCALENWAACAPTACSTLRCALPTGYGAWWPWTAAPGRRS